MSSKCLSTGLCIDPFPQGDSINFSSLCNNEITITRNAAFFLSRYVFWEVCIAANSRKIKLAAHCFRKFSVNLMYVNLVLNSICEKFLTDIWSLQMLFAGGAHASVWSEDVQQKHSLRIFFTFSTSICNLFSGDEWSILGTKFDKSDLSGIELCLHKSDFYVASRLLLRGQSFLSYAYV